MVLPVNTLPLSATDWCGKQVQSFREAFWTLTFENPSINSLLTVVPGIKGKQQIVILGLLDLVGKTKTMNQCAPDASDQVIPDQQKFWNPNQVEDRFIECWKDLLEKFYVWGLKNNYQKPDLSGTEFADFLIERVIDGLIQSIYRIAWFGDTAITNASAGGVLKNGVDVRYFNAIDGLWKQFFAVAAAFPNHYVPIPNNYGGVATPVAAPVLTPSTTGGTLPASTTWRVAFAFTNASGETPISPEAAPATTTGATSSISVALPALPTGATGYKVYYRNGAGAFATYIAGATSPIVIIAPTGTAGTPVTQNGATTSAAQKFTAADTTNQLITGIFQQIVDNADTRLVGNMANDARPQFFVTRSVMNQYRAERRNFPYIALAYDRTETGFGRMEFDGYDVIELDFEDRFINSYLSDGTSSYLPHRIYFTNVLNLQLGVEEQGTMTNVEDFYVPESKLYYIDTLYTIDVKEIEDYKVSLAY